MDEMAEAVMRQMDRRAESMRVDRRGWTTAQWVEDARRLMDEPDGAVTSLVNGHVTRLFAALDTALDQLDIREGSRVLGPEQCCEQACNGGGCETCRCCSAGWCVTGRDGLPEDAADLAGWIEVARVEALAVARADLAEAGSGRDAIDYVGKIANRLGVDDPARVWRGRYHLEAVGQAALAEIERLRADLAVAERSMPKIGAVEPSPEIRAQIEAWYVALDAVPAAEPGSGGELWREAGAWEQRTLDGVEPRDLAPMDPADVHEPAAETGGGEA